nr:hypothetical protein [Streptomyces sp. AC495_CC817]
MIARPRSSPPTLRRCGSTPGKLAGNAKACALAMLDHACADVAATIREHIVDRKSNNSRTVDPTDPMLLAPVS